MALITTGLTNGGVTNHYKFQYDDSLSAPLNPGGPEPARTNALIAGCESDFALMSGWFGNIGLTVGTPIEVDVSPGPYASAGWGPPIRLTPGDASDANLCRYLLVSEVTEMFMMAQAKGWFAPDGSNEGSAGEGLSRFLGSQFLISIGLPPAMPGFDLANSWMSSSRGDFVNHIDTGDHGIDAKTGSAILFIYYLFSQLGFTIEQIVAAAASELSGVYANLTGDSSDPFPFFKQLLDTAFPGTATIGGANPDNPFPLGILSFWVDKSTFGRDEVNDVITSGSHGNFPNAFWLVLEGFNVLGFSKAGVAPPTLAGAFKNLPGVSITPDPSGTAFEVPGNANIPQRIRFPFDIKFSNATLALFPALGAAPKQELLNASVNAAGHALPGANAAAEFELVGGEDPYFTNVDPAQGNVFYLSQDLRVFTSTPATNNRPVAGGPAFANDNFAGAYQYIQDVLAWLNNPNNHFTDGGQDPFASGVIPNQSGALTGDSSVTPLSFSFFPFGVFSNYNFAIARVRLRGALANAANNVKVFFRMWSTQSADTDFLSGSTYLSHQVAGKPEWPLPAPDAHTIPFFATGNNPNLGDPANAEYGANGVNNRRVDIQSGDVRWAYFGCFLNVYDPGNMVNGSPVQALLAGTHHCLVAELAYDDAPIVNANGVTMTPENSDKLAQRNLQLTHSDNPGPAETHRIPQTFDARPSRAMAAVAGDLLDYPDELMIDWGATPPGSIAHIFWPQVNAMQVLALANRIYGTHVLSASDSHTIDCTVTPGVTYIPIPYSAGESFAGLLTIDLPQTVVTGQEFNVVVRRVSTRQIEVNPNPVIGVPAQKRIQTRLESNLGKRKTESREVVDQKPHRVKGMRNWRYVVGTFHVRIPVTTREVMLRPDEDALAIMKWRMQAMAPANRWYPVLKRYISYLGARIQGLGGNPDAIPPSLNGAPVKDDRAPGLVSFTGKVIEVNYDCFGLFEGFVLKECCETREFRSRDCAVAEIALRACKQCLLLTVYIEKDNESCIRRLVIRC